MPDARSERFDLDAEAIVLSASMLSADALVEVQAVLRAEDFYSSANSWIYRAICALAEAGETVDSAGVLLWLRERERDKAVGGSPYLLAIVDAAPATADIERHATVVRDLARQRRAQQTFARLAAEGREPHPDVEAWLQRAEAELFRATETDQVSEGTASDFVDLMRQELAEDTDDKGPTRGLSTGIDRFDALTGGLAEGDFWLLAGRPSMGKTSLLLQFLGAVAQRGYLAIMFALESQRRELRRRAISQESGVPAVRIANRDLSADEWQKLTDAIDRLAKWPLRIDDDSNLTPARMRSKVRRYVAQMRAKFGDLPLGLIAVDYLQLMRGDGRSRSREEELEAISRSQKLLAKEFKCAVVDCAQLNRSFKDRKDKRPMLSDLRGSGALEQDADNIVFIHREDCYRATDHDGLGELIVAKGRNCGTGVTHVRFQDYCAKFWQLAEDEFDDYTDT